MIYIGITGQKKIIKIGLYRKLLLLPKKIIFLYQKLMNFIKILKNKRPYPKTDKDEYTSFLELNLRNSNESKKVDYAYEKLFQNDIIKWYSDDMPLENASSLEIKKQEDIYSITFFQGKEEYDFPTYSVRFRNSGSRYHPYNFAFMSMYNALSEYDSNYHQIHIEEYLYNKKITKAKKNKEPIWLLNLYI